MKKIIESIKKITVKDILIFPFWLIFNICASPFHLIIFMANIFYKISEIPKIGNLLDLLLKALLILSLVYLYSLTK